MTRIPFNSTQEQPQQRVAPAPEQSRFNLKLSAPRSLAALTLLFCSSTLMCCALPAFLVLLGAGSVMATLLSWFPAMVILSQQKVLVFGLALCMLVLAGQSLKRSERASCPLDPARAQRCRRRLIQARVIYALSCTAFVLGSTVAYGIPLVQGH